MLKINSNIAGVIRQTERLKQAIPEAMNRALAPDKWIDLARDTALRILFAIAAPAQQKFVPDFVKTVSAGVLASPAGLSLRMQSPFDQLRDMIAEAQAARGVLSPTDLGMGLFQGQVTAFEDLISQWVSTPEAQGGKRRDSRDSGKTDEEITHLISYIMLSPKIGFKGYVARERLMPHLEDFIRKAQGDRLDAVTVDAWLRTVLEAWRQMVRMHYLPKVKAELKEMMGELV